MLLFSTGLKVSYFIFQDVLLISAYLKPIYTVEISRIVRAIFSIFIKSQRKINQFLFKKRQKFLLLYLLNSSFEEKPKEYE